MTNEIETWVVYKRTIRGSTVGINSVCKQHEWEAMERNKPGQHALVRDGIKSEAEAEMLARAGVVAAELAVIQERKLQRSKRAALVQAKASEREV